MRKEKGQAGQRCSLRRVIRLACYIGRDAARWRQAQRARHYIELLVLPALWMRFRHSLGTTCRRLRTYLGDRVDPCAWRTMAAFVGATASAIVVAILVYQRIIPPREIASPPPMREVIWVERTPTPPRAASTPPAASVVPTPSPSPSATPRSCPTRSRDEFGDPDFYQVQEGDSTSWLSRCFEVALEELLLANDIPDANVIFVAEWLRIPGTARGGLTTLLDRSLEREAEAFYTYMNNLRSDLLRHPSARNQTASWSPGLSDVASSQVLDWVDCFVVKAGYPIIDVSLGFIYPVEIIPLSRPHPTEVAIYATTEWILSRPSEDGFATIRWVFIERISLKRSDNSFQIVAFEWHPRREPLMTSTSAE